MSASSLSFESVFKRSPDVIAKAHGRVNLIGEHTDYNGGYVLPIPIPHKTEIKLAKRDDRIVRIASSAFEDSGIIQYELGEEKAAGNWQDYVQGISAYLEEHYTISGFDARFETAVPLGVGLSSSAALELSLLRALRSAFELPLDELQLARIGQMVENSFVGVRVGIMDQISAAVGKPGFALFVDTSNLQYEHIALPEQCSLATIDSGIKHELRTSRYNLRRQECEEACLLLGISHLRDVGDRHLQNLPDPFRKRARHVFTENQRVLKAVVALHESNLGKLGSLLYASHESMKNDYEVSLPEIDLLVDLSREHSIYGARLIGGGFGGSVLFLMMPGQENVLSRIADRYHKETGYIPSVNLVTPEKTL